MYYGNYENHLSYNASEDGAIKKAILKSFNILEVYRDTYGLDFNLGFEYFLKNAIDLVNTEFNNHIRKEIILDKNFLVLTFETISEFGDNCILEYMFNKYKFLRDDFKNSSALCRAALYDHIDTVSALIDLQSNIYAENKFDTRDLIDFLSCGNKNSLNYLLDNFGYDYRFEKYPRFIDNNDKTTILDVFFENAGFLCTDIYDDNEKNFYSEFLNNLIKNTKNYCYKDYILQNMSIDDFINASVKIASKRNFNNIKNIRKNRKKGVVLDCASSEICSNQIYENNKNACILF